MPRIGWLAGVLAFVACNGSGVDSGKSDAGPATCDQFMTVLADCYAAAGHELSEGGIDPEQWCADFEESGADASIFDCYVAQVEAGECGSSEGVARTSESLQVCEDTE